tara:strand:- start:505 stop:1206 length:702 start_codon:yes stop_codon:yes gene_type:complete
MGQSAGSLAAQAYSNNISSTFSADRVSIIPDSYIGVFPPNSQGPLIYNFGACSTDVLTPSLQKLCLAQELTLQDLMLEYLAATPSIPFSFIQSKTDTTQISYYIALAVSVGQNPIMTENMFYTQASDIMAQYNVYPNFLVYLVDGSQHTYTPLKVYYTAGPDGARDTSTNSTMLHDWVDLYPTHHGDIVNTICDGDAVSPDSEIASRATRVPLFGNNYCRTDVYPKSFEDTLP